MTRTLFLARLLGLFLIIVSLAILLHREAMIATIDELLLDRPVILVIGVIALAAGLAMVLGHNIWHGGTLPVVVTLLGWLLFIRGLVLLFLTPPQLTQLVAPLDSGAMLTISNLVALAIGLYLAYAGFAAPSRRATAS